MENNTMKFTKKAIAMLLMIALAVGMIPISQVSAASKLKLNAAKASLTVGQSKQLKVKSTKKKVTWSSNKKSVATVSKTGKVKAKKAGKATITAKVGKIRLKCTITVKNKKKTAKKKVLVAYFSATGSTKRVAGFIQSTANADIYRIKPQKPYTEDDLDWTVDNSRANQEHNSGSEPAISGKVSNINQYDVIYLGYPIWWGEAPNIMHTFLKSHDLSGKTIIPFCTSASSGLGSSDKNLYKFAPQANWQKGKRFESDASKKSVQNWVKTLKY